MRKRFFISGLIISAILCSCNNMENDMEPDDNEIYAGYSVSGEEGKDFVTIFFHFHSGRPDGPGLALQAPSKIFLDSVLLVPDSAKGSGVYYEIQVPIQDFSGSHTIRFVDTDNKEYSEKFLFKPFRLVDEIADTLTRDDLILHFEGLQEKDLLRVVMTDTTFEDEAVNTLDTVYNNKLDLRKYLSENSKGPVTLHLFKEEDRFLRKNPLQKGEISITYSLKREFELKD